LVAFDCLQSPIRAAHQLQFELGQVDLDLSLAIGVKSGREASPLQRA
jgi:hypothetical protein